MTLYLVKWDDGTFALVAAENDEALIVTLDQLGDPSGASWQVYEGPLWLEFPEISPVQPAEGDIDPFRLDLGKAELPATDDAGEFADAVLAAVHPNLAALRERAIHEERLITRAEFDQAVKADEDWALPGTVYGSADGPDN